MEGLTFELRVNLDLLKGGGVHIDELRAIGGGARSDLWLQLKADITGIPVVVPRVTEAACWGAAVLAGVGAGYFASASEAAEETLHLERRFEPDPERLHDMRERFALYREVYPTLKGITPPDVTGAAVRRGWPRIPQHGTGVLDEGIAKDKRGSWARRAVRRARPRDRPRRVLMKVWAAGVCGSDLLIQEDRHFYEAPVTLGHEYSGVAYQVGKDVTRVKEGDKFVADIECGEGQWLGVTIDGAYAPYMRVPEHVIYRMPDHVSLDHACLAEPIVATHHLIQERAQVKVGDDVVIVGPGPMGIMAVLYAKVCGARRVFLIGLKSDEKRLQIGKACGADYALYSEDGPEKAVMEITGGKGAEFVLECSASQEGVQHAIDCARKAYEGPGGKGVVVFISLWGRKITVNLDEVSLGQLDIRGSWSWNGQETWDHAIDLLDRGVFDLDPMITNHYELDEWETAFANLRAKQDVKAFIHPNGRGWAE